LDGSERSEQRRQPARQFDEEAS